jgi:8-oxo-dGTP diphosphatase
MAVIHVVGAAIFHQGRCLVALRSASMSLPLKWEFPGGKIEPGESPEVALRREVQEELGLDVEVQGLLGQGQSMHDGRSIELSVYRARFLAGDLELAEHAEARWFAASELSALDWAAADIPIVPLAEKVLDDAVFEDLGKKG